jgi:hypothetical protein
LTNSDDDIPFAKGLGRLENRAVFFVDALYSFNESVPMGLVQKWWTYSMCTEPGRAVGRELITLGVYRPTLMLKGTKELVQLNRENREISECRFFYPSLF